MGTPLLLELEKVKVANGETRGMVLFIADATG